MVGSKYNKAYEAFQEAVYRDSKNPYFWSAIGVLYFQINQFRDALDAYTRAIRINPFISEIWFVSSTILFLVKPLPGSTLVPYTSRLTIN